MVQPWPPVPFLRSLIINHSTCEWSCRSTTVPYCLSFKPSMRENSPTLSTLPVRDRLKLTTLATREGSVTQNTKWTQTNPRATVKPDQMSDDKGLVRYLFRTTSQQHKVYSRGLLSLYPYYSTLSIGSSWFSRR